MRSDYPGQDHELLRLPGAMEFRKNGTIQEICPAFEGLVADLSARFINLPLDRVDVEIQKAQGRVCQFFGLDRSAIWQFTNLESGILRLAHLYHQPLINPPSVQETQQTHLEEADGHIHMHVGNANFVFMDGERHFPWITRRIRGNQAVIITSLDDLPDEAVADREFLLHYGTKSSVMIPLMDEGRIRGLITFAMLLEEKVWSALEINRFHLLARIFANVLARQRIDLVLRDSEARLRMAMEAAHIGLWDVDLASGDTWITSQACQLFDLPPDDKRNPDKLIGMIQPGGLDHLRQKLQNTDASQEISRNDLRITLPDGQCRWITTFGRKYDKLPGEPVRMIGLVQDITERKRMEDELKLRLDEITDLKKQLERENLYLKEECKFLNGHTDIVGQSAAIQKVFLQIEQVATTDSHVLITGETGTGKELVARAIHAASKRKDRMMVKVNCATLPSSLIESELFGREKGAYTDALTRQIGRFEMADGGTIFLDEIGELSVDLQAKLLRVLQEGEFERLGGPKTIRVNVRVIAATNRNLMEAVNKNEFRKDLFYRLSVFPINVPPLRLRAEDIPLLVWEFIGQFNDRMGKHIKSVPQKTMEQLKRCFWPGNIRELRNTIERAMILSQNDCLELQMPEETEITDTPVLNFKEAESRLILDALHKAGMHIKGPQGAAALLGLKPSTLYTKMNKLGINHRRPQDAKPS